MLAEAVRFPLSREQIEFQRWARELVVRVADEAVPDARVEERLARFYPAERRCREVRGWTIAGGTTEILWDAVGAKLLRGYGDE